MRFLPRPEGRCPAQGTHGHRCSHTCALKQRVASQRRALRGLLGLNAGAFLAVLAGGWWAGSSAVLGDAVDMLGDATVYGASLAVVGAGARARAGVAALKGVLMLVFAASVLVYAGIRLQAGVLPDAGLMAAFGALTLGVNAACCLLIARHRQDDINLRSAWVCTRNDLLASAGVLLAAAGVAVTGSLWPDFLVGAVIAGIVLTSGLRVLRAALRELAAPQATAMRPAP